jgi:hypothetical protein
MTDVDAAVHTARAGLPQGDILEQDAEDDGSVGAFTATATAGTQRGIYFSGYDVVEDARYAFADVSFKLPGQVAVVNMPAVATHARTTGFFASPISAVLWSSP